MNRRGQMAGVLTALFLAGFGACHNAHPSDEMNFSCDPETDSCPPGETCVLAGAFYVCSSTTECLGACPEGKACADGECKCFKLDCAGRDCGADLCGGTCGSCQSTEWCNDGTCEDDCGSLECGLSPHGLDCGMCEEGWLCKYGQCEDDCAGRECGNSPELGVSCGACQSTEWCNGGTCEDDCGSLECGLSPHGLDCGMCEEGWLCKYGQCEDDCAGRECGNSPELGVSCGACQSTEWCNGGTCEDDCGSLECGLSPHGLDCGMCSPGHGCLWEECVETGEMKLVASGSFWMGCNSGVDTECSSDESPYHEVTLSGYYMDKTEVTQGEYKKCVDAEVCDTPTCEWDPTSMPNHPVVCVTWTEAGEYCQWAGKRLPTEAEWEKAARGTDGRKYPWGNEDATCDFAVMYGCPGDALNVCAKSSVGDSPYGLCDMAGNVWEWVLDWYDSEYYVNDLVSNPTGPVGGSGRVSRGGSFATYDDLLRASNRSDYSPSDVYGNLGFRCARDAP